jgi:hypothetical protein
MRLFRQCTLLIAAGLLLSAFSTRLLAQAGGQPEQSAKTESSMTGCLSKDSNGAYVLTDSTGNKIAISGTTPDLEKHAANHTVTLTGKMGADASGKPTMEVSKLKHVSDTCKSQ